MKWWPDVCLPGDMVRVRIGAVKHYGVFISENEIIQFGPPPVSLGAIDNRDICVCAATAEEFSCGNIIEKAVLDRGESRRRLPLDKTVEIARSRLGEKGYSLLHNNCEHFAYECVFGEKRSVQEEEARERWNNRAILDIYIAKLPEDILIKPVSCAEREKEIQRTHNSELKKARFFDWQVLMYAANRSFGLNGEKLTYKKSSNGRWSCDQFFFSLTHTEGAVAVAVSNGKVGIDMENISAFNKKSYSDAASVSRLLRRISTQREENSAADNDFITLWLKKESIFKCCGERFSPREIESSDHKTEVYTLVNYPELRFSVCGEKAENARVFLYENGSARLINSEVVKNGSDQ